jgi:hypothetical protein
MERSGRFVFLRIKNYLKEKQHIIVIAILSVYLAALAVKTGHLYYTEVWSKQEPPGKTRPE